MDDSSRSRQVGMLLGWVAVAAVAVLVGILAVRMVGDTIRDRGPLGNEAIRTAELEEGAGVPEPGGPRTTGTFRGEYGAFETECRGVYAYGVDARPASGWSVVSYEQGPDDDVDAVFANRGRSIELEVFCNRGRPTLAELERKTLPSD